MSFYVKVSDLKDIRVRHWIGVKAFADMIGISSRTVQMIEKGESVNVSKLKIYLNGLNEISREDYKLIIEAEKTTQND